MPKAHAVPPTVNRLDTIDYTDYTYTSIYKAGTLYVVFTRYSGTKSYCMIAGVSCHLSLTGSSGHGYDACHL